MADINLHSTPTIIFVEDCYLPQTVPWVEETLAMWEDDDSQQCEVFGLVFDTFARTARAERSLN